MDPLFERRRDSLQQEGGAVWRNDVVVLEGHRQRRAADRVEPYRPPRKLEGAGDQRIFSVELVDVLPIAGPRKGDIVVAPGFQRQKTLERLVVPGAVGQVHRLRKG